MKEDINYMKEYFQERIDKDFIESDDVALNFMKVALSYIKQLEEENKELNKKLKIKTGDIEYLQNKINKHFISDVKIEEKIEEYKKQLNNLKPDELVIEDYLETKIKALEEILGEN